MTTPTIPTLAPVDPSAARPDGSDGEFVRRAGIAFILAFAGALRAVRLYPAHNAAVEHAVAEVVRAAAAILDHEQELDLRTAGEFVFINGTRLRLDLHNYASFGYLLSTCGAADVGSIRLRGRATSDDWLALLAALQGHPAAPAASQAAVAEVDGATGDDRRLDATVAALTESAAAVFDLGPEQPNTGAPVTQGADKAAGRRTYARSVAATREVMNSVRLGQPPNLKRVKRAVQSIVDQILQDETSLVGLTTLRDYDEYTFTHSVNVCIFSVALGRRLGLTKPQLYDLGLAAIFHDIGKSRVPAEIINKQGALAPEEWRQITAHPWLGVLALFQMRGQDEPAYRAMVVAYEHHMKVDLSGYPRPVRPRAISIFSRIVAVADSFDAATTQRSYQTEPWTPAAVLRELHENRARGMDPVIVKAFISLTGIYPVGTLVVLDTGEMAVVHAPSAGTEALSRPTVQLVLHAGGKRAEPGTLVDLAARDAAGRYARTITRTADPTQHGISVSDYFV